jgi:hypothetical protein
MNQQGPIVHEQDQKEIEPGPDLVRRETENETGGGAETQCKRREKSTHGEQLGRSTGEETRAAAVAGKNKNADSENPSARRKSQEPGASGGALLGSTRLNRDETGPGLVE